MFNSELKRKVENLEYNLQDCKEELRETRKILSALFDHLNLCAKHEPPTNGKWVIEKKFDASYYTQPESLYKPKATTFVYARKGLGVITKIKSEGYKELSFTLSGYGDGEVVFEASDDPEFSEVYLLACTEMTTGIATSRTDATTPTTFVVPLSLNYVRLRIARGQCGVYRKAVVKMR